MGPNLVTDEFAGQRHGSSSHIWAVFTYPRFRSHPAWCASTLLQSTSTIEDVCIAVALQLSFDCDFKHVDSNIHELSSRKHWIVYQACAMNTAVQCKLIRKEQSQEMLLGFLFGACVLCHENCIHPTLQLSGAANLSPKRWESWLICRRKTYK